MKPLEATHIGRALRKTAQLRALTLSLQRAEQSYNRERLVEEFEGFLNQLQTAAQNHQPVSVPSADVLLTGIKACWARGDLDTIKKIADLVPQEFLNQNLLIRSYIDAVKGKFD